MCAHKDKHRTPSDEMVEVDDGLKLRGGGTLVIVPVIALAQWRTELLKWTEPGTFSIYTYHGQQREKDVKKLSQYDVVLTTYSTLEYEYRDAKVRREPSASKQAKHHHPLSLTHTRFPPSFPFPFPLPLGEGRLQVLQQEVRLRREARLPQHLLLRPECAYDGRPGEDGPQESWQSEYGRLEQKGAEEEREEGKEEEGGVVVGVGVGAERRGRR